MANTSDPVVIVAGARTPMGSFQGALQSTTAPELGAVAIKSVMDRTGIAADEVAEVLMGCVLPAGQGQAPARRRRATAGSRTACLARPSTRCAARA